MGDAEAPGVGGAVRPERLGGDLDRFCVASDLGEHGGEAAQRRPFVERVLGDPRRGERLGVDPERVVEGPDLL